MHIPFLRSYSQFSSNFRPQENPVPPPDLEKNIASDARTTTPTPATPQIVYPPIDPSALPSKLLKFQNIIGISVPPAIRSDQPHRPGQNLGIYKRTVDKEVKSKFQWQLSTWVINACFLLQIIVGAALTALGAAGGPSAAVTILGAINTILAGLLTYLKGQGLPGRLEQHFQLMRTLREHIEERERDFAEPGCLLNVDDEIEAIVAMYKEIRQTVQDNMPGNVLPPRGGISDLMKKANDARGNIEGLLKHGQGGAVKKIMSGLHEITEKSEEQRHKAEATVNEKGKEAKDVEERIRQSMSHDIEERKRAAGERVETVRRDMGRAEDEIEEYRRATGEQMEDVERDMRRTGDDIERLHSGLRKL